MKRSYPPDVVALDTDSLVHARFAPGSQSPRLVQAKSYRLPAETFTPAVVTPQLTSPESLTEALRRMKNETGKWDKVSLLLPDAWFRINILDLPALPDDAAEALQVVRWSLKRTIPIPPDQLRVTYAEVSRSGAGARVLALSAMETTLAAIERAFAAAGLEVILLEPVGLNIWNAISVREPDTNEDRMLVHVRDSDFTTAVFRGDQPLFIRSRNLSGERSVEQEIRLSATYLRDTLGLENVAACHIAGTRSDSVRETLAAEFRTTVREVVLRDHVEDVPPGLPALDAELTACIGVFTA